MRCISLSPWNYALYRSCRVRLNFMAFALLALNAVAPECYALPLNTSGGYCAEAVDWRVHSISVEKNGPFNTKDGSCSSSSWQFKG